MRPTSSFAPRSTRSVNDDLTGHDRKPRRARALEECGAVLADDRHLLSTDENYRVVAENQTLRADTIARLYQVAPDSVQIYRLPDIRVVKISFPRPTNQGGIHDRDMHAGQQHIPMSQLVLHQPEH